MGHQPSITGHRPPPHPAGPVGFSRCRLVQAAAWFQSAMADLGLISKFSSHHRKMTPSKCSFSAPTRPANWAAMSVFSQAPLARTHREHREGKSCRKQNSAAIKSSPKWEKKKPRRASKLLNDSGVRRSRALDVSGLAPQKFASATGGKSGLPHRRQQRDAHLGTC